MKYINKTDWKKDYSKIPNQISQSKTLTPEQIGILARLLSLPENFKINKSTIWRQFNIGRENFKKIWRSLTDLGYIKTIKTCNDKTKTFGYVHSVFDVPQPQNPLTRNWTTDNTKNIEEPSSENHWTGIEEKIPVDQKPVIQEPVDGKLVDIKRHNKKEKEKYVLELVILDLCTGVTEQNRTTTIDNSISNIEKEPVDNNSNENILTGCSETSVMNPSTGITEQNRTSIDNNEKLKTRTEMNPNEELQDELKRLEYYYQKKQGEILNVGYWTKEQVQQIKEMEPDELNLYFGSVIELPPMDMERIEPMIMELAEMFDRIEEINNNIKNKN